MLARRPVPLTLPKVPSLFQSLSCGHLAPVTAFRINTYRIPASVDSKQLAEYLNPLAATLTKNRGEGKPYEQSGPTASLEMIINTANHCIRKFPFFADGANAGTEFVGTPDYRASHRTYRMAWNIVH